MAEAMPPQPRYACHDLPACVHASGGNRNRRLAGGHGENDRWEWHCMADGQGCEGYSVILLVAEEWLSDDERKWLAGFRARRSA